MGTWEAPRESKDGGWGGAKEGKEGGWGGARPEYFTGEWSGGEVEVSPGSAWKREPPAVGSWADDVQTPRSEPEENPLVGAIGAKKSLSNW